MAFPTLTSTAATGFAFSVTSFPLTMPASIASGDLLIAIVEIRIGTTWTAPSGWTAISTIAQAGGGGVGQLNGWYKIAAGTESGTTPTWTTVNATSAQAHVHRVTGWHGTTAPEATTSSGDSSAANPPSLTPSWGADDTLWLAIGGHTAQSTAPWTAAPSGYSGFDLDSASSGGGVAAIASSWRNNNATSEDPGAFTVNTVPGVSSHNRYWTAATIAIRPSAGGGTTGQIKVWNGTSFVAKPMKVWNGTSWVTKPVKRWNGTSWVTTPY